MHSFKAIARAGLDLRWQCNPVPGGMMQFVGDWPLRSCLDLHSCFADAAHHCMFQIKRALPSVHCSRTCGVFQKLVSQTLSVCFHFQSSRADIPSRALTSSTRNCCEFSRSHCFDGVQKPRSLSKSFSVCRQSRCFACMKLWLKR